MVFVTLIPFLFPSANRPHSFDRLRFYMGPSSSFKRLSIESFQPDLSKMCSICRNGLCDDCDSRLYLVRDRRGYRWLRVLLYLLFLGDTLIGSNATTTTCREVPAGSIATLGRSLGFWNLLWMVVWSCSDTLGGAVVSLVVPEGVDVDSCVSGGGSIGSVLLIRVAKSYPASSERWDGGWWWRC